MDDLSFSPELSEQLHPVYHARTPGFLLRFAQTPELQRLRQVGMNCGCEYTHFPRFVELGPYSRYTHSVGVARIVWHFTQSREQTLAALFHDIATPTFAHTIDFLNQDHLSQESTEADTALVIRSSPEICHLLEEYSISLAAVSDYHQYPLADNDSPRLSADRLEYTLGNLLNFGFASLAQLRRWYSSLIPAPNEAGVPELCFSTVEDASAFSTLALECFRIYVCPEDRYAMQMLSELLRDALGAGIITRTDFNSTEPLLIHKLTAHPLFARRWAAYCALSRILPGTRNAEDGSRVIPAKRRCIDPYVAGRGRLSELDAAYAQLLSAFLQEDQTAPIRGIAE